MKEKFIISLALTAVGVGVGAIIIAGVTAVDFISSKLKIRK